MRFFGTCVVALVMTVACGCPVGSFAQNSPAEGMVTGHVVCRDTQRPARLARVILYPIPSDFAPAPVGNMKLNWTLSSATHGAMNNASAAQTLTNVDGAFTLSNVPPGDYYVLARVQGYVLPQDVLRAAYDAGADLRAPVPGVTAVHVAAGRSVTANVMIDRGAAITGRVLWDDGTPLSNATVTTISAKDVKGLPMQFGGLAMGTGNLYGAVATSDDLGRFRLAGLPPGDYLVEAKIQAGTHFVQNGSVLVGDSSLVVYAPNAFHKVDAKPVTLHVGEEVSDEDLTVNLNGLHTVSGQVVSSEDGHGINAATVTLRDTTDETFSRTAKVDESGSFTVPFVPAGTYNLAVTEAQDRVRKQLEYGYYEKVVGDYRDGNEALTVTDQDVTGENVALTPMKTKDGAGGGKN